MQLAQYKAWQTSDSTSLVSGRLTFDRDVHDLRRCILLWLRCLRRLHVDRAIHLREHGQHSPTLHVDQFLQQAVARLQLALLQAQLLQLLLELQRLPLAVRQLLPLPLAELPLCAPAGTRIGWSPEPSGDNDTSLCVVQRLLTFRS